jgi:HAE1 family hydrophobic/amphiphilic exporter-1
LLAQHTPHDVSGFFLRRPIFAGVISAIILTVGLIAIPGLPIAQFPQIAPPQINLSATYPGANATQVEAAVTTPIEEAINGSQGLRYISSLSGDDGTVSMSATFDLDRDINSAATDVLVAIQQANGSLPSVVKTEGVTVNKSVGSFLMIATLTSTDGRYDPLFLSNYASLQVVDPLKRIPGVGQITIFGQRQYAMRLWLDPKKLADNGLATSDVANALGSQNVQVPSGAFGSEPSIPGQPYYLSVDVLGQLQSAGEFDEIILRTTPSGGIIRLKDVGRAELGSDQYASVAELDDRPTIGIGIQQTPGANALSVSAAVTAKLRELALRFPPGVRWDLPSDTTDFVRESIREVTITLSIAILLVVLVIYLFLQDWRTTLIPAITIPVSLVGTFGFVSALHFSINTLTLFGLTLATGLVVDDAIVVIENIARLMQAHPERSPFENAREAMREITGAVVATSLVLLAVFVPVGFFPGTTGQLYKQFALTIACSVSISLVIALTLTPALSVMLVRGDPHRSGRLFGTINRAIAATRATYARLLLWIVGARNLVAAGFAVSLVVTVLVFVFTPTGFLPDEDLGYFFVSIQAPQGTPLWREQQIGREVEKIVRREPAIRFVFNISGRGIGGSGNATNLGFVVIRLKPWSERSSANAQLPNILADLKAPLAQVRGARLLAFGPPSVQGLGAVGGFQYELEDRSFGSISALDEVAKDLIAKANASGAVTNASTTYSAIAPHLEITVDRRKAEAAGVNVGDVFAALQTDIGSYYVNDFTYLDRTYHVYMQGDAPFREQISDLDKVYVRSSSGVATPVSQFLTYTQHPSAPIITHFDLFRNIEITGSTPPGVGTGQSIQEMENLSQDLPHAYAHDWSGIALEQITGGSQAGLIFALGVLFVFFVLAAQYESVTEPFIILLATPVAILGALVALHLRAISSDVYAQVGYVMLIGLASKNAILIVEFSNQLRRRGMSAEDAVMHAAETRLRPILMTSIAFIFGIAPLVWATGAGAASRHSLGTAIFGGMIVSTALNLIIIPALYLIVAGFDKRFDHHADDRPAAPVPKPEAVPV